MIQYKAKQENMFHTAQVPLGKREDFYWERGVHYTIGVGWDPGNIPHGVWLCGCVISNLFFKPFIHVLHILPGDIIHIKN